LKPAFIVVGLTALCLISSLCVQGQAPATSAPQEAAKPAPAASGTQAPAKTAPGADPAPEGQTSARSASAAPAATVEEIALKYVDMWNTGDKVKIKAFPVFVMHSHRARVMVFGEQLYKVITAWRTSMPDLKFKVEDTLVQGDRLAMRLSFTGTYKERLFPNTADPSIHPRNIHSTEMLFFKLYPKGEIEIWEEYDELAMRGQMGGLWKTNEELAAIYEKQKREEENAPHPHVEIPIPSDSPQP
jgi:predicted ester cyclase